MSFRLVQFFNKGSILKIIYFKTHTTYHIEYPFPFHIECTLFTFTRTFIFVCSQESSLECPTPANSFSGTSKDEKSLTNQSIDGQTNSNGPSTSKFDECNANQIDDYSTTYQPAARTQSSVMRRISNLMIRNNVNVMIVTWPIS